MSERIMENYIYTGRFQPLHRGHLAFLEQAKRLHPNALLIICIIRNYAYNYSSSIVNSSFFKAYHEKELPENNPLPNWNRYYLLKLAIASNPVLCHNTEVIFRSRPELDWDDSLLDLPDNRIWLMGKNERDAGEKTKVQFYHDKHERIELVDVPQEFSKYSGTNIRNLLRSENPSLEFLPDACQDYFLSECLRYFL